MELKIQFRKDFELIRVKNTLAKLDWYNSQGYKPKLPEGITNNSSEEEIQNQIIKEFEEKNYKEVANKLKSDFSTIKDKLSEKLKEIFKKDIPETFVVYLTNYGVGGSYNLPNLVIYNINNKKNFKTIIHEIIHLLLENQIQEFSFLEYNNWQSNYHGVEKYIDELFNRHFFQNEEEFFYKIKKARAVSFLKLV